MIIIIITIIMIIIIVIAIIVIINMKIYWFIFNEFLSNLAPHLIIYIFLQI